MSDTVLKDEAYASLDEGLAAARVVREQQGLEPALRLLGRLGEQYPASPAVVNRASAMLLEDGRLDDADAWLGEARSRFPRDLGLAMQHARLAQRRRDFDEATRRWQTVRGEFPDDPAGEICFIAMLREFGQLDDAESVAVAALERFPDVPALLVEHAFVAGARRDWAVAADRWDAARALQPDHHVGYVVGALCLRECGRIDASEELLRDAVERFPHLAVPMVEFAWLAHVRGDWDTALDRWEAVRAQFPDEMARYMGVAKASRELQRFDEADEVLSEAVTRFPNEMGLLIEYAGLANHRREWPEAARRWALVQERHPQNPIGYHMGAAALREANQLDDAEAVLTAAEQRFPKTAAILSEYVLIAQRRLDWVTVEHRSERLRQIAPGVQLGYTAGGYALRQSRQFAEAEALLEDAMQRFPNAPELFLDFADVATRRGDWDVALQRFMEARQRFPADTRVQRALHEAQLRAGGDLDASETQETGSPNGADANAETREIVSAFASLGGEPRGCEFGEMQRFYGAEPLDLLRWTHAPPLGLIEALETRFDGIGDSEQTEIFPHKFGDRWYYEVRDRRFGMGTHTYIAQEDAPQEKVAAQTCRRMQYLRRKLIEDLEAANKIFVYRTVMRNLSDDEIDRLHAALRSYNDDTTLLYVRYADDTHPDGTVDVAGPGLLIGYLEHFGAVPSGEFLDIPFASWATLCREAYLLRQSGTTRGTDDALANEATGTDDGPSEATQDNASSYLVQEEPAPIYETQDYPAPIHETQDEAAAIPETAAGTSFEETPRTGWRQIVASIFRRRT